MNAELHAGLHKIEVNACNLGIDDALRHGLGCDATVEGVPVDEATFFGTASVRFQHIDAIDGVLYFPLQAKISE